MEAVYLDLHIHTSKNPNALNNDYNIDLLLQKIKEYSNNSLFLISLTDHNTINKESYLHLIDKTKNVILGVELHIVNYEERPPYHCHIFFNIPEINVENIDNINSILDKLYPNKEITSATKLHDVESIIRKLC